MAESESTNGCGLKFFIMGLALLFIGLKLGKVIDWSWWLVLSPLWGWVALAIALWVALVLAVAISEAVKGTAKK